jgi:hypothetical protein
MRVTIKFDTLETEYPNLVSEAAKSLMLASRGIVTDRVTTPATETLPDETDTDDTGDEPEIRTAPASDAAVVTPVKKRGRPSNAKKVAETAPAPEAETTAPETTPDVAIGYGIAENTLMSSASFQQSVASAPPPMFQPSTTNTMPSFPAPGAATVAPTPVFTPPVAQSQVQPAAMPPVTSTAAETDRTFTVEDLRAVIAEANKAKTGFAFQIMRRRQWQDGTEKAPWTLLEQVPAEHRERLAMEILAELQL